MNLLERQQKMAKKIPIFACRINGKRLAIDRNDLLVTWIETFKDKDKLELTLKKKKVMKSYPQLKYYMGVVVPQAHIAFIANGETVTKEDGTEVPVDSFDADCKLKRLFLTRNRGTEYEHVPSKADISVEDMFYLTEQSLHYLAINYSVYIETPEEWKDAYRILNEGDKDVVL
jgi:hypothetical protein